MSYEHLIGKHLKELRAVKGLTQDDVAYMLNVKRQTYSAYERGVSIPDAITLKKLADYLGVTTDYIIGKWESNDPTPTTAKTPVYDDEALEMMEEFHKRPELKILFSTTKNAKKEDIEFADQMLKRMAGRDYED